MIPRLPYFYLQLMTKPTERIHQSDILDKAYQRLIDEDEARYCKELPDSACHVLPGNFFLMISATLFTKLGDALINAKTVLPWMIGALGAPVAFMAWLVPIRESGSLLPQMFIAGLIRKMPVRKWVWVGGSLGQAAAIVAMLFIVLTMDGLAGGFALITALIVFSLARGFCSIANKDVLGKTIPKKRRGRVSGLSASAAGLITLGVGTLLVINNDQNAEQPLLVLLICAALMWILAPLVFALIREKPGETDGASSFLREGIKKFALLKTDTAFRNLCISRSLLLSSALSAPYYVAIARERNDDISLLGLLMLAAGAAALISGRFWGRLADKSSRKVLILSATLTLLSGSGVAAINWLWVDAPAWIFVLAFFCLEVIHNGVRLGRKTYVVDMAEGNQRTDYVATSNTLIGAILLLTGSLGLLSHYIGAGGMVALFAVIAGIGALWALRLPEIGEG